MQRDPSFFNGKISPTGAHGVGGNIHHTPLGGHYTYGAPIIPASGAVLAGAKHDFLQCPLNGVEFEPTETCPKNFIIFDQSPNKSRVMFHPALAHKLNCHTNFDDYAAHAYEGNKTAEKNDEDENRLSSSLKEDTEDINALLSSEEDDEDEEEDDEVSTGRTPNYWGDSSPDPSGSEEGLKSTSPHKSFSSGSDSSSSSGRKRERMRKMVKVLRGIIPGGEEMDTPVVLDEAVKYLKSLKVEVKKLGMQNLKS